MPGTASVTKVGSNKVDAILSGVKWVTTDLTYSFPKKFWFYNYNPEKNNNFQMFNSTQQDAVDKILKQFAGVSGLKLTKVNENFTSEGDLRYAMSDSPSGAWAYYPATASYGGDSWYNNSGKFNDNPRIGNWAYSTLIHETGHAVGLKHGHENDGGFPALHKKFDSNEYSVMTYRSFSGQNLNKDYSAEEWGEPQTLMMLDIAALQHMYGANYNYRSKDTVYKWLPNKGTTFVDGKGQGTPGANRIFMTVWDGGGRDTYDFTKYKTDLKVNLKPGSWSTTSADQLAKIGAESDGSKTYYATGNIANSLLYNGNKASLIENAKGGSGDDAMIGNVADNALTGGLGNDTLRGLSGEDKLKGGKGDDFLIGHKADDLIYGGHGHDKINGNSGDDKLLGGAGNDTIKGSGGNDTLKGGSGRDILEGQQGADNLNGGSGDDTLIGGKGADTYFFAPGSGNDLIRGFDPNVDKINLSAYKAINKFNDLKFDKNGSDLTIILNDKNQITLENVNKGQIDADDFIF